VIQKKAVSQGIAAIVESYYAVRYINMIPRESVTRDDALCVKSLHRHLPQKHSCKNGAGTMPKKYSVG
jgi:hypothetical protein